MKTLKTIGLAGILSTAVNFGAMAQTSTDIFSITSTHGTEGGELHLNDPMTSGFVFTDKSWAIDNFQGNLRFFRNYTPNSSISLMNSLLIKNNQITVSTPNVGLTNVSALNSNFIISGLGARTNGLGASLGFAIDATKSGSGSAWECGRILVVPGTTNDNSAAGNMYIQTRISNPVGIPGEWQWNKNLVLNSDGAVSINSDKFPTGYMLAVNGKIIAQGVKVSMSEGTQWPDFVFAKNFKLRSLEEVESYIAENSHLPEVPSESEVKENGIDMAEMMKIQMQKIEELTLYMIQLKKENEELNKKVAALLTEQE